MKRSQKLWTLRWTKQNTLSRFSSSLKISVNSPEWTAGSFYVNATLFQVCFIEDQVSFLQAASKASFPEWEWSSWPLCSRPDPAAAARCCETLHSLVWSWTTRKWMYISVRVLGSSALSLSFNTWSRTVAVIQQKTGMWHMMWRLRDSSMWETILPACSSSPNLLLKLLLLLRVTEPSHLGHHVDAFRRDLIGCCGVVWFIQRRAEGSSLPRMRFVQQHFHWSRLCDVSRISLLWKSRWSRHSSRPSKMNTTWSFSNLQIPASLVSLKTWWTSSTNCSFLLSANWALGKWTERQSVCCGWLCLQPSPGCTSALTQFSRCRPLPLSPEFGLVHLFQVKVWIYHHIRLLFLNSPVFGTPLLSVWPRVDRWPLRSLPLWRTVLCRSGSEVLGSCFGNSFKHTLKLVLQFRL